MVTNLAQLLPSSRRVAVMGILNITPDSFSDGGRFLDSGNVVLDAVIASAEAMIEAGVDIFDVGAESTRPGAKPVDEKHELARLLPVVKMLKMRFEVPVSVDTSSPGVIRAVAESGADMINDVRALSREGALTAASKSGLPVCLMHMPAEPQTMQQLANYPDVVKEVKQYLLARVDACVQAGITRKKIAIDPGFGFGKNLDHNMALFRAIPEFVAEGLPVMVGVSRKRMIGDILNKPVENRLYGSLALALLAVQLGAKIIRVHDVSATVDVIKMLTATGKD